MTLTQLLEAAAKAAGALPALARQVAVQLAKSPDSTPEVERLAAELAHGLPARWPKLKTDALAAARAALFGLDAMIREGEDTRALMPKLQASDAKKEQESVQRYGAGRWRCPRCGSQRVDDEHTERGDVRFTQLLCDACGAVGDGFDGAPGLAKWSRDPSV
jgi:hypothetical protein